MSRVAEKRHAATRSVKELESGHRDQANHEEKVTRAIIESGIRVF